MPLVGSQLRSPRLHHSWPGLRGGCFVSQHPAGAPSTPSLPTPGRTKAAGVKVPRWRARASEAVARHLAGGLVSRAPVINRLLIFAEHLPCAKPWSLDGQRGRWSGRGAVPREGQEPGSERGLSTAGFPPEEVSDGVLETAWASRQVSKWEQGSTAIRIRTGFPAAGPPGLPRGTRSPPTAHLLSLLQPCPGLSSPSLHLPPGERDSPVQGNWGLCPKD